MRVAVLICNSPRDSCICCVVIATASNALCSCRVSESVQAS
jgi:hypothetical protein